MCMCTYAYTYLWLYSDLFKHKYLSMHSMAVNERNMATWRTERTHALFVSAHVHVIVHAHRHLNTGTLLSRQRQLKRPCHKHLQNLETWDITTKAAGSGRLMNSGASVAVSRSEPTHLANRRVWPPPPRARSTNVEATQCSRQQTTMHVVLDEIRRCIKFSCS